MGGLPGTRPLVVDPFAGGGAIPLEALRVGADAFASDLNPVAVLLNKVVLEYIPKYGQRLADQVRTWGQWIKEQAEKELGDFYPKDPDGATPIAYLWARTIRCEGPNCGAEVPLMRSFWLAKKSKRSRALKLDSSSSGKAGGLRDHREPEALSSGRWHRGAWLRNVSVLRVHDTGGIRADPIEGAQRRSCRRTAVLRCHDPCRCAREILPASHTRRMSRRLRRPRRSLSAGRRATEAICRWCRMS